MYSKLILATLNLVPKASTISPKTSHNKTDINIKVAHSDRANRSDNHNQSQT
jgi:hypothetical protein